MPQLDTRQKLEILADAAKYDASCASSGSVKRDSRGGKGIGSTDAGMSLIALYRPSTGRILWTRAGPWSAQHDVSILDDHRIMRSGR